MQGQNLASVGRDQVVLLIKLVISEKEQPEVWLKPAQIEFGQELNFDWSFTAESRLEVGKILALGPKLLATLGDVDESGLMPDQLVLPVDGFQAGMYAVLRHDASKLGEYFLHRVEDNLTIGAMVMALIAPTS